MKRYGYPETIVTDRFRSCRRAAMKVIGNAERQETGRWLNNRAENSHQPFRRRERAMAKFRSAKSLQKFASIHSSVHNHFNLERTPIAAKTSNASAPRPLQSGVNLRPELAGSTVLATHFLT
jgi:putative transposase